MNDFHFEDPDLKSSTIEIEFSSCLIEKDNFIDSQWRQSPTENKESFQAEVRKHWQICAANAVAVLFAKGTLITYSQQQVKPA